MMKKQDTENSTKILLEKLAAFKRPPDKALNERRSLASNIAEPMGVYDFGQEMTQPLSSSDQLAVSVWQRLKGLEAAYAARGRSLTDLGPLDALCERMVATIPAPSLWDDLLGPFYGPGQIAKLLGNISRQAVADRRRRGTLLGLQTADGVWVYPVFQFGPDNEILPGLPAILKPLAESGVDAWTLAGWIVSPLETLAGSSPIEWLKQGEDLATLLPLTQDAARRFHQ